MTADQLNTKIAQLNEQAKAINAQLQARSPEMQLVLGQIKALEMVKASLNGEAKEHAPDPDPVEIPQG